MNFKFLKPLLFVAAIVAFTVACKDASTQEEKAPVEQKSEPAASQTNAPATPAKTATQKDVALNPPHGQPGHRCDIAVGQPLDSKPAQNSGKVNPPHGQPGHRCDLAVGAPLPE